MAKYVGPHLLYVVGRYVPAAAQKSHAASGFHQGDGCARARAELYKAPEGGVSGIPGLAYDTDHVLQQTLVHINAPDEGGNPGQRRRVDDRIHPRGVDLSVSTQQLLFFVLRRIPDQALHEEAVYLGLGKRIRALLFKIGRAHV